MATNNPTLCEVLTDGKACGNYSSHIYRSAFATRFVCDACARRYREEGSQNPLLEFSLLELVPARQVLVDRLARQTEAYQKLQALVALDASERTVKTYAGAAIGLVGIVAVGVATGLPGILVIVAWVLVALGVDVVITRKRSQPRLAALHKKFGYPELGL